MHHASSSPARRTRAGLFTSGLLSTILLASCGPSASPDDAREAVREPDDAAGGRLFDRWYVGREGDARFDPDSAESESLDGVGGPFGNGTLADGQGRPMPNTGHGYRLKNLFGWDLRGAAGIYGPDYQGRANVLPIDLLEGDLRGRALRDRLRLGGEGVPAYGDVLSETELDDLVAFIEGVRAGRIARPDQIFSLEREVPSNYRLLEGGDAERGHTLYTQRCASCHGEDGTRLTFDDGEHSAGSLARAKAYEVWIKILNGQPGTPMGRQVPGDLSGREQSRFILDLLAALCDRGRYPAPEGQADVAEGDVRCGAYLR